MNELARHLEWLDELKYIVYNRIEMVPADRSEFIQLEEKQEFIQLKEKNRTQCGQLFREYSNFVVFERDIKSLDTYYMERFLSRMEEFLNYQGYAGIMDYLSEWHTMYWIARELVKRIYRYCRLQDTFVIRFPSLWKFEEERPYDTLYRSFQLLNIVKFYEQSLSGLLALWNLIEKWAEGVLELLNMKNLSSDDLRQINTRNEQIIQLFQLPEETDYSYH